MKLKLLLCGATLLVAGCSTPESQYATSGEYSYTYDYIPQPVPDITPVDLDKINLLPPTGSSPSSFSASQRTGVGSDY